MEMLNIALEFIDEMLAHPERGQIGFAVLLGVAAFILMMALMLLIGGLADPVRRRLRSLAPEASGADAGGRGVAARLVEPIGDYALPSNRDARTRTASQLRHAGVRAPTALRTFYGAKLTLAVVLPALVLVALVGTGRVPLDLMLAYAGGAGVVGYLAPNLWLSRAVRRRQQLIRRALPDALDLLVVCAEAGLGLRAAIQTVAADLEVSHPELAGELTLFTMQTQAGMDNRDALRDLEERTGVDDIRGLVTTLVQSMRFGTSVADTLRIYSAELRDKRQQRAEELAAKVGTKMLFPLVLCILPALLVVMLGPPLLGALAALGGR
jgi:tight adherence protein C